MTLFLKAKHWQLFLLAFGLPMTFHILSMIILFKNKDPEMIFDYFKFFPAMMLLFTFILFGWIYSVAIKFQSKVPDGIKMKVTKFKIFLFIPFAYILIIMVWVGSMMTGIFSDTSGPNPAIFLLIVPLHLFSMFCIFYCLYFVAKTIKTVELQREVIFNDFIGEFFLVWFYFIGVWILQPKINKIANE